MILFIHIFLALSSIVVATYSSFRPTKNKLTLSYLLTIGTLISAGMVAVQTHTSFGHACLSGLFYLGLVSVGLIITRRRLSPLHSK